MSASRALTSEKKYQLLLGIAHAISGTFDPNEILGHLLDVVGSVVAYDAGGIFVVNRSDVVADAKPLRLGQAPAAIVGMSARGFDPRPVEDDPMRRLGRGIVGHVIRTGEPVIVADVRSDPRYVEGRRRTRSEIAVPITMGGQAIGALNLESDGVSSFDDTDLEVLRFFADAAAISIEKAVLHRHLLEKRRIEEQLDVARDVQARLLPATSPIVAGFDMAGLCLPTFDIGGDYFDFVPLAEGRLGVVVADVSGKGIGAALIMSAFRAVLRSHAQAAASPDELMRTVNRLLPDSTGAKAFVTAVYGVLEPLSGRFCYANCGHSPPVVLRVDGRAEELTEGGPLLGVFDPVDIRAGEITIGPGDVLVIYTDGVTETATADNEEFGVARLIATVAGARRAAVSTILDNVVQATRRFSEAPDQRDDLTLVVIRRH